MPDGLDKILDEVRKNPELLLTKYLRAERLVLREENSKKSPTPGQRVYKDAVVLFTEGMAFFIDEEDKLHQVAPDIVQEIVYSPEASQWMRQLMLFSASQMINQLMLSKKFERPEP
ncbi:MAG: hypothetical protein FJ149_08625 [Euryarchaeota archaeon]|nr:hypothetical protein [Euryarchaeota archaeon]